MSSFLLGINPAEFMKQSTISAICHLAKVVLLTLALTITTNQCTGSVNERNMFEIPANYRRKFLLMDCQTGERDSLNCRCKDLERDCQESDTNTCKNCHCLNGNTRTFYVEKRYGALCLSPNNLMTAAGFGETFLVYNPPGRACARSRHSDISNIYHSNVCNANDPSQVWFWTPGNLIMNALNQMCLTVEEEIKDYRNLFLFRCNSSAATQKWLCNERFYFGVSSQKNSTTITHAIRYWVKRPKLLARAIAKKVDSGNIWNQYPGNNLSICAARSQEGFFYLSKNKIQSSQIDLVPKCSNSTFGCFKEERLLALLMGVDRLSNCSILFPEWPALNRGEQYFTLETRADDIYFKWSSNPYSPLAGTTLDLTIQCLDDKLKFQEFSFPLGIKNITVRTIKECYKFTASEHLTTEFTMATLDLSNDCVESACTRQIEAPLKLRKNCAVCNILSNESTTLIDGNSFTFDNITSLFSLRKVTNESFSLQWNSTSISLIKGKAFNLTILCYDDRNENYTVLEKSCLAFQTKYNTESFYNITSEGSKRLEIILPVVIVIVLCLTLLTIFCFYHQRRRTLKTPRESQANLQEDLGNQNETARHNFDAIELASNGFQHSDNPCYEESTPIAHPVVTIARNKLYEHTEPTKRTRPDSDAYEKPFQSVKIFRKAFECESLASDSSKRTPPQTPPRRPRKEKKQDLIETDTTPAMMSQSETPDFYEEPSGFIPSGKETLHDDTSGKTTLAVPNVDNRLSTPYEKPLPLSPDEDQPRVYDYATREDMARSPNLNRCTAERPFDSDNCYANVTCSESPGGTPFYDVLDDTDD